MQKIVKFLNRVFYGGDGYGREPGPREAIDKQWKIKPDTKPVVVLYGRVNASEDSYWFDRQETSSSNPCGNNLKITFDGETGELKAAQVLKG